MLTRISWERRLAIDVVVGQEVDIVCGTAETYWGHKGRFRKPIGYLRDGNGMPETSRIAADRQREHLALAMTWSQPCKINHSRQLKMTQPSIDGYEQFTLGRPMELLGIVLYLPRRSPRHSLR